MSQKTIQPFFLIFTLIAVLSLSACQNLGGTMLTSDNELNGKILALAKAHSEPVELRSLTGFEWDEFAFAPEGTKVDTLEDVFGERIVNDQRYYTNSRNLFVFRKDGQIVRALMISADWFDNREALTFYSNQVRVGFIDTEYRPDLLHFVE